MMQTFWYCEECNTVGRKNVPKRPKIATIIKLLKQIADAHIKVKPSCANVNGDYILFCGSMNELPDWAQDMFKEAELRALEG